MWTPLLEPGLTLLHGHHAELRAFHQEIAHFAVHGRPGHVLWCDGSHGFDPYDFAELNLTRGRSADEGADRVLVKRCLTPFQWDSVLTQHLAQKLAAVEASLVLCAPYDRLFSTDELSDWEQEDYVRYSLGHLKGLARRHQVPILISVDMGRWWRTHPVLARLAYEATESRWMVHHTDAGWRAVQEGTGVELAPRSATVATLFDYTTETDATPEPALVASAPPRRRPRARDATLDEP